MYAKKEQVRALLNAGITSKEAAVMTGMSCRTAERIKAKIKDDKDASLAAAPRSGRPRTARTRTVMAKMEQSIKANPAMNIADHARRLAISRSSASRIMAEIGGKSLRRIERPLLTEQMMEKRLVRVRILLNDLKHAPAKRVIFFSDEKTFTVDPVFNRQNDRFISVKSMNNAMEDPRQYVRKTKHPASVMMLGVVASTGEMSPPIFFPIGYRLTAAKYIEVLSSTIIPWMVRVAGDRAFVFQQDGAPAHTAKATQDFLKTTVPFWPKNFWPPSSPDINPLDYGIWWQIEKKACATRSKNIENLKASITREWNALSPNFIHATCTAFRGHLTKIIEGKGNLLK